MPVTSDPAPAAISPAPSTITHMLVLFPAPSPLPVFGGRTPAPWFPPDGVCVGGTGVVDGALVLDGAAVDVAAPVGVDVGVCVLRSTVGVAHVWPGTHVAVNSGVGVGELTPAPAVCTYPNIVPSTARLPSIKPAPSVVSLFTFTIGSS